jgi:DNA-binding transcriptional LysR family regulator
MSKTKRPASELNWQDISTFLAAADAGSLRAAGRQLKLDRSTIRRRIERLEQTLKCRLFVESHVGEAMSQLTPAGETLLPTARKMELQARIIASGEFRKDQDPS